MHYEEAEDDENESGDEEEESDEFDEQDEDAGANAVEEDEKYSGQKDGEDEEVHQLLGASYAGQKAKQKLKKFGYKMSGGLRLTQRKANSTCADCNGTGHWKCDLGCPKVADGTTPQFKPKKKVRQAHFVGGTACPKRASGSEQRERLSEASRERE